jgi:hypothetical protein
VRDRPTPGQAHSAAAPAPEACLTPTVRTAAERLDTRWRKASTQPGPSTRRSPEWLAAVDYHDVQPGINVGSRWVHMIPAA